MADFLDWATDNYEIDGESHEVIPRMLPLEVASSVARSSHEKRTGSGRQMPPNPPLAKCDTCTRFTGLLSNAYIQVRTCLDCGHQTRTKCVQVFTERPETRRHQDLDKRGISKFTARLFCKQCGTFVDELPQAEARRRRQLGQDIATLPSSAIDTTERVITAEKDDVCLDQEGAYHMMTIFQQDLDLELQSGEPVRAAVVYETLANAIEAVREADPEHCFMAVALSPMDDQIVGPALRVVDIWNDEGVWAVLDEGCNSTAGGSEWTERAVEAYAAVGYDVVKVSDETTHFKGLSGVTKTHGSYRIPFALTFVNNNQKLPGIMEIHVASPSTKMMPVKAPTPTRTVTTRAAPAEFKQLPPQPPPPPPREERKEAIAIRSRTPTRRAAPGSARDRLAPTYPWPGYASSRASSTSHREEEPSPSNELLETMKAMQKQLDELKKEKGEATHRRRRRSPFARAMSTIKNQKRFARLKEAKNTLTSAR